MVMNSVWIIIPTYNEKENLPELLAAIFDLPLGLTVLVVDDNSPDGTGDLAKKLMSKYERLYVINRAGKLGLGSAYREGFAYALKHGAEVVGEMDADFSHAPQDIPRLLETIKRGAEVVIGSRRVRGGEVVGWSWWRYLASWGAMSVARLVLGLKIKDVTAGFRFYTKVALGRIPWARVKSDGYAWQEEILFLCERACLKVVEVPVVFVDRKYGKSKLNSKNIFDFFRTIFRLRLIKK